MPSVQSKSTDLSQTQGKREERSPDDASRYCSGKVIVLPSCKQSSRGKGGKNLITNNEGGALIIVVKLLRTDTTLDLSQKARVVRKQECWASGFYRKAGSYARTS